MASKKRSSNSSKARTFISRHSARSRRHSEHDSEVVARKKRSSLAERRDSALALLAQLKSRIRALSRASRSESGEDGDKSRQQSSASAPACSRLRRPEHAMLHISPDSSLVGNGAGPSKARCTENCSVPCPLTSMPRIPSASPRLAKRESRKSGECRESDVKMMIPLLSLSRWPSVDDDGNCRASKTCEETKGETKHADITMYRRRESSSTTNYRRPSDKQPEIRVPVSENGCPDVASLFGQIDGCKNANRIHYLETMCEDAPESGLCYQAVGDYYREHPEALPERECPERSTEQQRLRRETLPEVKAQFHREGFGYPFRTKRVSCKGLRLFGWRKRKDSKEVSEQENEEEDEEMKFEQAMWKKRGRGSSLHDIGPKNERLSSSTVDTCPGYGYRASVLAASDSPETLANAKVGICYERTNWIPKLKHKGRVALWKMKLYKSDGTWCCERAKLDHEEWLVKRATI